MGKKRNNEAQKQGQKGKKKQREEENNSTPPSTPPPNRSPQQQRRSQNVPAPASNGASSSQENELEILRRRVREFESRQVTSNEAMASLQNENRLLGAKLAEVQPSRASRPKKKRLIRRPKGSSWCLQDEMGLVNDELKYKRIIRTLKNVKKEAGFKDGALYRDQSRDKILKYCRAARKQVAFLRRFKRDWATTAYLRRSFRNRRGYLKREPNVDENGAGPSGTRHTDDDDDDDDIEVDKDLAQESDEDDFMDGSEDDDDDDGDEDQG